MTRKIGQRDRRQLSGGRHVRARRAPVYDETTLTSSARRHSVANVSGSTPTKALTPTRPPSRYTGRSENGGQSATSTPKSRLRRMVPSRWSIRTASGPARNTPSPTGRRNRGCGCRLAATTRAFRRRPRIEPRADHVLHMAQPTIPHAPQGPTIGFVEWLAPHHAAVQRRHLQCQALAQVTSVQIGGQLTCSIDSGSSCAWASTPRRSRSAVKPM